jgi:hypothetical protein
MGKSIFAARQAIDRLHTDMRGAFPGKLNAMINQT